MQEQAIDPELCKKADEYDFKTDLKVGSYLDVDNYNGNYYLAQVVYVSPSFILVNFDGFDGKLYNTVNYR